MTLRRIVFSLAAALAVFAGFASAPPAAAGPAASAPAARAIAPALALPAQSPSGPTSFAGTLGTFVQVSDACSYYPLTPCGGGAEVQISARVADGLAAWVGQTVRIDVEYEVCGSGIAGQPLTGPVAVRVEALHAPCPAAVTCRRLTGRVPDAAIQAALANPSNVMGWLDRCNPAIPGSPVNGLRYNLSLRNSAVPYHPIYNHLVFRCGCP